MSGEVAAILSAVCYAISILLLRKGQFQTYGSDNGLFPLLTVSGTILLCNLVFDFVDDPEPLIHGNQWLPSIVFCVLSGVVATLFGRLALYGAVAKIGATRGIIITTMAPLVTLVLAITILGERFYLVDAIGVMLLLSGAGVLILEKSFAVHRSFYPVLQSGLMLAMIACTFQGVGFAFRKLGVSVPIDPIFAACLDVLSALAVYSLLLLVTGRFHAYVQYYARHLNLYLISAGFVSSAAVFLFFEASLSLPVSEVSVVMGSQPVIATVLSGLFMRNMEKITWLTGGSALLVTCGVVVLGLK